MSFAPVFRQIPNAISLARLISVPVLAWLAYAYMEKAYTWLLLAALASDAIDGYIARTFELSSKVGAMLDSIADALLMLVIGYGILVFRPVVYDDYGWIVLGVVILWAIEHVAALVRYGKPSRFHTGLVRTAVLVFATFIVTLFLFGFYPWLFFLTALLSLLAVFEQLALIWLVPEWTPDIRGGLPEVLRERRRGS